MEDDALSEKTIGCAMKVHRILGPGVLESVYEQALAHELRKAGLQVECQRVIQVTYDNVVVGDFIADMLVENRIMIENKAIQALVQAYEVQLVNYLTAPGIDSGLLFNFGAQSLQHKRKYRIYRKNKNPVNPVNPV